MSETLRRPPQCPFLKDGTFVSGKTYKDFKKWLAIMIVDFKEKPTVLSNRFDIPRSTIRSYVEHYKNNTPMYDDGGRPPIISAENASELISELSGKHIQTGKKHFSERFDHFAQKTSLERNESIQKQIKQVTDKTKSNFIKKHELETDNAELTTEARIEACEDVRNAITFAAMNAVVVPLSRPELIMNMDATSFQVGRCYGRPEKAVYKDKRSESVKMKGNKSNTGLPFSIKYYMLYTAKGDVAPPVYVIADHNLDKEDCSVYIVPGLGLTNLTNGYVIFSHTRCGNEKMYEFLNVTIIREFVLNLRQYYGIAEGPVAWLTLDGEARQIEVYTTSYIQLHMAELRTEVGKSSAGTTEINQPCDAGKCIKATKTELKGLNDEHVEMQVDMINYLRTEVFKKQINDHKRDDQSDCQYMTYEHVDMGVKGLLRIQLALQESMRPRLMRESFAKTGIYPLSTKKILANCTTPISTELYISIQDHMPTLCAEMQAKGEISDALMLQLFPSIEPVTGMKDHLVTTRRRSIMLTNKEYIRTEYEKVVAKEADAVAKAAEKVAKKAVAAERKRVREEKKALAEAKRARLLGPT